MPICIECRYPVTQLYTTYAAADDRSLGKGVRLTQCPRCKRFADKYVEHDFVVLFIDLVLIKPQVILPSMHISWHEPDLGLINRYIDIYSSIVSKAKMTNSMYVHSIQYFSFLKNSYG